MSDFTFSTITVGANSKSVHAITVAEHLDGSPIQIPVAMINGAKPGPCTWVLAGIDGDEIESIIGLQRAIKAIDPAQLTGSVVAILASNPLAVRDVSRISPIDGKCLNEVFPGSETGTYTERLASQLFSSITERLTADDIVLSLHGGGRSARAAGLIEIHGTGDKIEERGLELAKMACNPDLSIIVRIEERQGKWVDLYKGNLTRELYQFMPVAPLTIEAGGMGLMRERDIQGTCQAIINVLQGTGSLPGKPIPPEDDIIVTKENQRVFPTSRGFWLPNVEAGSLIEKEQLIAKVVNIYGHELELLKSPIDGVVLYMRGFGVIDPWSSKLQDVYGSNIGIIS